MKRIGLTGNIGTGKSTIARIFEVLGIPVYHADYQARLILETSDVVEKIALLFGNQIIDEKESDDSSYDESKTDDGDSNG